MSTDFKCNDGDEHDFDSNTESEYCAKGCGEKWAIYAIKKLGADLKEKDAAVEQLKAELKESNDSWQRERLSAANYQVIEQLKSENERLNKLAEGISAREESISAEHKLRIEIESENAVLKSKLEIAKKALEFYGDRESYVEDQEFHTIDSLNNDDEFLEKYQARVGGKTARQALKEINGG